MIGLLERLRAAELGVVRDRFHPGMTVLELGGGSGFQSGVMESWGCRVVAIDLASRRPSLQTFYQVIDYDGLRVPLLDACCDVVFSSNVLEHVTSLSAVLAETRRVLKPAGVGIHVLPSVSWRIWTSLLAYPVLPKRLFTRVSRRARPAGRSAVPTSGALTGASRSGGISASLLSLLRRAVLLPFEPHGEYSSAIAELYYYRRARWRRVFEGNGFQVVAQLSGNLFYTGNQLLTHLSLDRRRWIARFAGASTTLFITRPAPSTSG